MKNESNKASSIGGQIRQAREEMNMSQLDLAKATGFESATAISLMESDQRKVTIDTLQKLGDVLHKDIKYFLGAEEKPTVTTEFALRADPHLNKEDKEALLHLIDLAKKRKNGK